MKQILLIDDDQDEAEIFKVAVAAVDHTAIFNYIGNCIEALKALRLRLIPLPHLIFLDINMPLMNGFDCLQQIKQADGIGHIPVIMYSTSSRPGDRIRATALGATELWNKPNRLSDLQKKLKDLISSLC